ncbi:MAG: T9SS type A sorting domain-containing protein [bacterium]
MKRLLLLTLAVLLLAGLAYGQVNVTYRINSSTISGIGITDSTHQVQVCGSEVGPPGEDYWKNVFLTWDNASPLATNVGGDYWELVIEYPDSMIGWRMAYKFRYKTNDADEFTWEDNDNREWVLPDTDTTLALGYISNGWNPPYRETDSLDVFFRVNMNAVTDFNPDEDSVYIVGAFPGPDGADNMWVPDKYPLTKEEGGNIWNFDLKLLNHGTTYESIMYRFTLGSWDQSEQIFNHGMFPDNENRGITVTGDTTVAWKWYNDQPAVQKDHQDTMIVTWNADMSKAIASQGFSFGDTLEVRYGYFGTATEVGTMMMVRQGLSTVYAATDTVVATAGDPIDYQYYLIKKGNEYREIYYNFYYEGNVTGEAERRVYTPLADGVTIEDIVDSEADIHRMPIFRNLGIIDQDVLVTFECDVRPAYYQVLAGDSLVDIQSNLTVNDPDNVLALGVAMNGPASGEWGAWGAGLMQTDDHRMYDDGTHGDATAGDSVFTMQVQFYKDSSNNIVGQEFKFGIGGGDNEGGYGNNHIENIDDASSTFTIHSQFGSIDPAFYNAWDFDSEMPTSVDYIGGQPLTFALDQNYPNPFNPETQIHYSIPKTVNVTISVYNLLGQKITTLVNGKKQAGKHVITWNGRDDFDHQVSSGIYIYSIKAGDFSDTNKMLLMK